MLTSCFLYLLNESVHHEIQYVFTQVLDDATEKKI